MAKSFVFSIVLLIAESVGSLSVFSDSFSDKIGLGEATIYALIEGKGVSYSAAFWSSRGLKHERNSSLLAL